MKFKKSIMAVSTALSLALSTSVMANDTAEKAASTVKNAWTDCGIGAMLFKETPVGAVISNIIWDWGTTAVISMAASPETCKGVNVASAVFINESIDQIESDIARGEGQHVAAMLALMGCEESAHANVTKAIRNDIANNKSFAELGATEKAQQVYVTTEKHVAACSIS